MQKGLNNEKENKIMLGFRKFLKDEEASGVVELVLIIVVLIMLVMIFNDQIKTIVSSILKKISDQASAV